MNPLTIIGSFLALLIVVTAIVIPLGLLPSRRRQADWLFLTSQVKDKHTAVLAAIKKAISTRQGLRDVRGPNTQDTGIGQIPPVRDEDGQP